MWGIDDVESPTERALGLNLMAMTPPINAIKLSNKSI
jgi:hypothetical protein